MKYEYLNAWANISELLYYATHEEKRVEKRTKKAEKIPKDSQMKVVLFKFHMIIYTIGN